MLKPRESETVLAQFNDLIQQLLTGDLRRATFWPWEMRVLLDIEACDVAKSKFPGTLKRYQKAVQRHAAKGLGFPLLLSEYLAEQHSRRKPASAERAMTPRRRTPPLEAS